MNGNGFQCTVLSDGHGFRVKYAILRWVFTVESVVYGSPFRGGTDGYRVAIACERRSDTAMSGSIIGIELSGFPSTSRQRNCLFSIVYSCLLCHGLGDHMSMGLSLDLLSCSIDLYFYFCASTIPF